MLTVNSPHKVWLTRCDQWRHGWSGGRQVETKETAAGGGGRQGEAHMETRSSVLNFLPRTDLIPIGPRRRRRLITRGRRGQLSRSSSVWRSLLFTSEMSQSSFLHKLSLTSQNMFWSSSLLSDKALKNNNRIQIFLFLSAFLFFCLDSLLFLQTYRTARKLWKRKLFTNFFMKTIF